MTRTNADKHERQYFNQCFEKLFWYNVLCTEKSIRLKYLNIVDSVGQWYI